MKHSNKIHYRLGQMLLTLMLCCTTFGITMFGQTAKWYLQFDHIASNKGLSAPTNHFVYRDSRGFVWISSIEGLNRYDGKHIKVYKSNDIDSLSLIDDNIQSSFFEDSKGDIWFTTVNGINCYRRKRDNFDRFTIKNEGNVSNLIGYIAVFFEQNRWLWTEVGGKLYRFDTQAPSQYKTEILYDLEAVRFAIDTFSSGKVKMLIGCYWAIREGIDIINYDEQSNVVQKQSFFTKSNSNFPALKIKQILLEHDTLVWLSAGDFLVKFNPKKPSNFKLYKPSPFGATIRNISLSNNNDLWVSTNQTPLLLFDKKTEHFSNQFIHYSDFSKTLINAAQTYHDKMENLWVSTTQNGVFQTHLKHQQFSNPLQNSKQSSLSIEQIVEDKNGKTWINYLGITKNVGYYILNKNKEIYASQSIEPYSHFLQEGNGQFWYISNTGRFELYNENNNTFIKKLNIGNLDIRKVITIDDSTLLVSSTEGFFYFDTKKYKLIKSSNSNFSVALVKIGNKYILYDTPEGSIVCHEIQNRRLTNKIKELLSFKLVNSFHISLNNPSVLWAATAKGIAKINLNTFENTLLTEKDGLPSNYIQAVLEDKKGNLWCSTNQGITRYNPITKKSQLYTQRDGLSSDTYYRGAALLSSTGEMWFGGNNGVDVFHPDSIRDIGHAPQSAIVGLKIFDKYWKGETAIEVAEHITLKHNENTLTLELAAMEYTDPENNRFKTALVAEGDTIQWVDLGTQNYVTYPNLREGRYTFMLLTANTEGIWNETPKTLVIEIKPPYWRTGWFLTLVALATMSLVAYIVYLRLSKVIALQKIRLNLYENLHDDIGARLTAVVLLADQLRHKATIKDLNLERISTISRNIVANMRRLVWATAPENDALETVVQQMQTDRKLLLPSGTQFVLTTDKTLKTMQIGGDKRYQMLSVFNEALTNIAKYAEATSVETAIEIKEETLTMTVRDNGKGFDSNAPRENTVMSSGHGVRNMQRRASRIKGDLNITSKIGEGTSVQFSFSMKEDSFWAKFLSIFSKTPQN